MDQSIRTSNAPVLTRSPRGGRIVAVGHLVLFLSVQLVFFRIVSGRWLDFSPASYRQSVPTLCFSGPLDLFSHPEQILIIGILMGLTVAAPAMIGLLYGRRYGLGLIAVMILFGHLPVLGIVTVAGLFLATHPRVRRIGRRVGAALAVAMAVGYLIGVTAASEGLVQTPLERNWLWAPWFIAFGVGLALCLTGLTLTKWFGFRPGIVALLIGITFSVAVGLFARKIGTAELKYRLLLQRYHPGPSRISPYALWQLGGRHGPAVVGYEGWPRQQVESSARQLLDHYRKAARNACDRWLRSYPAAGQADQVCLARALIADSRIDLPALARYHSLHLYNDFPRPDSQPLWTEVISRTTDPKISSLANLRLGLLALRRANLNKAKARLLESVNLSKKALSEPPQDRSPGLWAVFRAPAPLVGPGELADANQKAQRWLERITFNARDTRYGADPLAEWATLDPHHPQYEDSLEELMTRFPDALLQDNWQVQRALAMTNTYRIKRDLMNILRRFGLSDGGCWAALHLAELDLRLAASSSSSSRSKGCIASGRKYLQQVIAKWPDSLVGKKAKQLAETLTDKSKPPGN